jgi:hypothetical protein
VNDLIRQEAKWELELKRAEARRETVPPCAAYMLLARIRHDANLIEALLAAEGVVEAIENARRFLPLQVMPPKSPAPVASGASLAARNAFTEMAKTGAAETVRSAVPDATGIVLKAVAAEGAKQVVGVMLGSIFAVIVKALDPVAKRVAELKADVEKLRGFAENESLVPLLIGVQGIVDALPLPQAPCLAAAFRQARLHRALDALDEAWVRAGALDEQMSGQIRVVTRYAQVVCALAIPGGIGLAEAHFAEGFVLVRDQLERLADAIVAEQAEIDRILAQSFDGDGRPLPDPRPTREEKKYRFRSSFPIRPDFNPRDHFELVTVTGATRAEQVAGIRETIGSLQEFAQRRLAFLGRTEALIDTVRRCSANA